MNELEKIWKEIDSCEECRISRNKLQHILGGGEEKNPAVMFVFINPTHRNISSSPNYSGPRFPFAGVNEMWGVFSKSGMLPKDFVEKIGKWNKGSVDFVLNSLKAKKIYLTNVVKCTKHNADNPTPA